MNKLIIVSVLLAAVLLACASTGSDSNATTVDAFADYTGWSKVNAATITGDTTGSLGPAHGGRSGFREVYVNSAGKPVSDGAAGLPYPMGTIVVKETYKDAGGQKGALKDITVMVKREAGYDAINGDWEYLNVSNTLKIKAQGPIKMCINCHASAMVDDYVFTSNR
jgi:hypothetical protein